MYYYLCTSVGRRASRKGVRISQVLNVLQEHARKGAFADDFKFGSPRSHYSKGTQKIGHLLVMVTIP